MLAQEELTAAMHANGNVKRSAEFTLTGGPIIGLIYEKGVILSADTGASYGKLARYKNIQRMYTCGSHTLIGGGGELSDLQHLHDILQEENMSDWVYEDANSMDPSEFASYASRILYQKRSKLTPLLTSLIVAGYKDNKPFLGYTDQFGTIFEEKFVATGMARYLSPSLLLEKYKPGMTEQEARDLLMDCWKVLLARNTGSFNRIQFATATEEGVAIEDPIKITVSWDLNAWSRPNILSRRE
ncbi:putative 20S proteasome subunit beta 7 [Cardiosporidium cionae]|uniref:Proteasome subunit beta n=1 Tax=Cardiosporidium cionae TaxID=476202 RepID=A0ABQ7J707_9APIC|nr:putative 20S proteasome subunit beta 7 [Cardiosporidium cionae]|eukprot:KAF8819738.1 putative 20S proteasome subunit beta 7 [Cardiosporidium cionae]